MILEMSIMKIIETIEKNLITVIGALFIALPVILEELTRYVPVEYSSAFGLLVLVVGKIYQANNFDTINRQKEENEEDIKAKGDIESSEKYSSETGTIPESPKYELEDDLDEVELSDEDSEDGA
jgi:hypothetical protein